MLVFQIKRGAHEFYTWLKFGWYFRAYDDSNEDNEWQWPTTTSGRLIFAENQNCGKRYWWWGRVQGPPFCFLFCFCFRRLWHWSGILPRIPHLDLQICHQFEHQTSPRKNSRWLRVFFGGGGKVDAIGLIVLSGWCSVSRGLYRLHVCCFNCPVGWAADRDLSESPHLSSGLWFISPFGRRKFVHETKFHNSVSEQNSTRKPDASVLDAPAGWKGTTGVLLWRRDIAWGPGHE